MAAFHISCLFVDDYSCENVIEISTCENEPVAVLGSEELISNMAVAEFFHMKHYIIIVRPFSCITFKRCIDEKQLIPGDKVIYKYSNSKPRR
ncbi:hypothetical protein RhiirA5_507832 [Rhizophagus irregularis]|uniref:Uncharacterized protein n=1 Tax=Rhizophagus irregularis TaxID=588596 RepID=A0A2N0NGZ5_9GLOM|nr:hypothetical protein RhiirA5_507832 [Rhizophagus irregularis]GET61953.1 hypothetical protein RIR_jg11975.t1 [Rhizophagus irregularis DAOM 181602=DAOM 197198]